MAYLTNKVLSISWYFEESLSFKYSESLLQNFNSKPPIFLASLHCSMIEMQREALGAYCEGGKRGPVRGKNITRKRLVAGKYSMTISINT